MEARHLLAHNLASQNLSPILKLCKDWFGGITFNSFVMRDGDEIEGGFVRYIKSNANGFDFTPTASCTIILLCLWLYFKCLRYNSQPQSSRRRDIPLRLGHHFIPNQKLPHRGLFVQCGEMRSQLTRNGLYRRCEMSSRVFSGILVVRNEE